MSKTIQVVLKDDITGDTEDVDTHTFAVDGVAYEVELSPASFAAFTEALAPYTAVARPIKPAKKQPQPTAKAKGSLKLSDADVARIRRDKAKGMSAAEVAQKWGVSTSYVYMLASGKYRVEK